MALQIILVMETNKRERTDLVYIDEVLDYFFNARNNNDIKISHVFMDGKGNYNKAKTVTSQIKSFVRQYSQLGSSHVVYCFDTDKFDSDSNDKKFLEKVEDYCGQNGYEFVWFCHDVEEVFLGKSVSKGEKVRCANQFQKNHLIEKIDCDKLCSATKVKSTSNLVDVISKIMGIAPLS